VRQWWNTSEAAWGLLALGIGGGIVLTYISRRVGIPVGVAITVIGITLVIRAYRGKTKYRVYLKRGGRKVIIGVGISIIIAGIIGGGFLIKSQMAVKTTIVYCCIRGNEYQVWAVNPPGNDKDSVFVTLGTSSRITEIEALMGASLPPIIEGGPNGNFITFKITELPPGVSLGYLIYVVSNAETPYKFTAWSETTTSKITARFVGKCPEIIEWGPEETAPP
jgi:hypothetical protein